MLYHRAQKQYLKKESLFHLNLISNSRPDQVKLVGRVVIDLSEIANSNKYSSVTTSKLMYCSVDADISFSLRLARSIESNLELNDLDRSSFRYFYKDSAICTASLLLLDMWPRIKCRSRKDFLIEEWSKKEGKIEIRWMKGKRWDIIL